MKYGIAVRIVETGYAEIDAECEAEAIAIAEGDAMEGLVLFHDVQVLDKFSFEEEKPKTISSPISEYEDEDELEDIRAEMKHIDKDALCVLLELFNYELDVQ